MSQRQVTHFLYSLGTVVETPGEPQGLQRTIVQQRVTYPWLMPPIVEYLIGTLASMAWVYEADIIEAASPNPRDVAATKPHVSALDAHEKEP